MYSIGPLGDHFLNEEGWLKDLIWDSDDESDFAEHAAEYAATLMGFDKDFYFTPYEELDARDYTNLIDMLCAPQYGVCSPQCPTATFDEELGKILITWIEVIDDCNKKPTSTIILLTPWDKEKGFPKDIILNQNAAEFLGSSLPHFPSPLAVLPQNMFKDMKDTKFEIDTIYFVSALYRFQSAKGEDRFGLPETSVTPL